ncbi:unnamed protein product [Pleuronectes platessa]|uniref:Uncharacterized protein n=1 Tax=Pleuronectes platessa TaxID=8262 RepID=A0A9N7UCH3_PLEPL|nr:unnamed protein product [Pleuronectes platessa]
MEGGDKAGGEEEGGGSIVVWGGEGRGREDGVCWMKRKARREGRGRRRRRRSGRAGQRRRERDHYSGSTAPSVGTVEQLIQTEYVGRFKGYSLLRSRQE